MRASRVGPAAGLPIETRTPPAEPISDSAKAAPPPGPDVDPRRSAEQAATAHPVPAIPPEPVDARPTGILLYGFVLPPEGSDQLESSSVVGLTDRHGEVRRSETGPEGEYSFHDLRRVATGSTRIPKPATRSASDRSRPPPAGDRRRSAPERQHRLLVEVVDSAGSMVRDLYAVRGSHVEPPGLDGRSRGMNNPVGVGAWLFSGQAGPIFLPRSSAACA